VRLLIQVLVGLSILLPLGVVLRLGDPRRSENPRMAWLLAAWGWVTVAFESLLFVATLGLRVPNWIAVIVLMSQNAVFAWWLIAVYRARRRHDSRHVE